MRSLLIFIVIMIASNAFEAGLKRAKNYEKNPTKKIKNKNKTSIDTIKKDQEKRKSSFKDILKEITKEIEEESNKHAEIKTNYPKESYNSLGDAIGFNNRADGTNGATKENEKLKDELDPKYLQAEDLTKDLVNYEKDYKGSLNKKVEDYKTIKEDNFYTDIVEESDEELRLNRLREAIVIKEILDKPVSMRE
ncbi:hypothetical protein [Peptoniphilus sp.]|uniref:hypothetical protein n=1 Tax=Peptoniphilus sp. TaxID=1971214 RepID=UPI00399657C8